MRGRELNPILKYGEYLFLESWLRRIPHASVWGFRNVSRVEES